MDVIRTQTPNTYACIQYLLPYSGKLLQDKIFVDFAVGLTFVNWHSRCSIAIT